MDESNTKRTRIEGISAFGERLSDAAMRLVYGGDGATSTADNRTCDEDGTPGGSSGPMVLANRDFYHQEYSDTR